LRYDPNPIRYVFANMDADRKAQEQGRKENNGIRARKEAKKRGRQSYDRPFELRFGFCFQQKCYGGWGSG